MAERNPLPITPASAGRGEPPRNGLEPAPTLERWICDGRRKDGGPCGAVLMELRLGDQGRVRIKCPRCDTWHVRGM